MTVADGSQTRLADISEVTIGTTPSTPAFQVMRYRSANIQLAKQTDISDEIRPDRNVPGITDVGRTFTGNIETRFSYGTFDTWLERLLCSAFSTNVLKNGVTHKAGTLEFTYEQGATDSYVRFAGTRINSLDLTMRSRAPVQASWGVMALLESTATAIIASATYTAATTTEDFNAGLNVGALTITSSTLVATPKIQALSLRITNNIYPIDVVGAYDPYAHGLGQFQVTGSITALFESLAVYTAIKNHEDTLLEFTLTDAAGNDIEFSLPKVKLLSGGPSVPGNNQPVIIEVPFQAFYSASDTASIVITRTPA